MKRLWLCASAACALSVCATGFSFAQTADKSADKTTAEPVQNLTQAPRMGPWGFDTSAEDPSVKPGDDFFRYADGKAVDKMVIPQDRSRYGAFDALRELSEARSRALIESPGAGAGRRWPWI